MPSRRRLVGCMPPIGALSWRVTCGAARSPTHATRSVYGARRSPPASMNHTDTGQPLSVADLERKLAKALAERDKMVTPTVNAAATANGSREGWIHAQYQSRLLTRPPLGGGGGGPRAQHVASIAMWAHRHRCLCHHRCHRRCLRPLAAAAAAARPPLHQRPKARQIAP